MKTNSKHHFFLGKGGVGKSTISALSSIKLSRDKKVLFVSMDPAHNLSDIFAQKFSDKPKSVNDNLQIIEIKIDKWIKEYLNDIELQVRKNYSYLTAFNLDDYFQMIKYSPGIEEYAMITAFKHLSERYKEKDYIIFDMPPTALTVKFFGLPHISLLWLEKLLELRKQILEKKEIITKIKIINKKKETDKILKKLNLQIDLFKNLEKEFTNKERTEINLVMNSDKLSLSESKLISSKLKEFNLSINELIINKISGSYSSEGIDNFIKYDKLILVKLSSEELIGKDKLEKFILENNI